MGVSGQKPKPSEQKRREGDRGHAGRKLGVDPKGKGRPTVPLHLTAEERKLWAEAVGSLPDHILTRADNAALELYVTAWQRYREFDAAIRKSGKLIQTPNGPRRNPLYTLMKDAAALVMRAGSELGMTAVSRARLARPEYETDPDDVFENFIFSGDDDDFRKVVN
jgi:P27 family predicted phage terminase small subunit